jgi:uncharacterized protein (TIGR02757 family)
MASLPGDPQDLFRRYHRARYLVTDPLEIVLGYPDPRDREVVGIVASLLAFGQVRALKVAIRRLLEPLGRHPAAALARSDPGSVSVPRGWRHRWLGPREGRLLLGVVAALLRDFGSLREAFMRGHGPGQKNVEAGLAALVEACRERVGRLSGRAWSRQPRPVRFLWPHPREGSACKRWNLFLRWMGRGGPGDLDPGLWRPGLRPDQLVVPLDVHLFRTARRLGWTRRAGPSWRAALEVTECLRDLDPRDPLRYDFALTRPGILGRWSQKGDHR